MRYWLSGLICLAGWLTARAEAPTCVIEVFAADVVERAADRLPLQRLDLVILDGQKNRAAATMGDITLAVEAEARAHSDNQWRVHLAIELTQWRHLPGVAEPTPTRNVLDTSLKLESGGAAQTVGRFSVRVDDGTPGHRVVTVRLVP